MHIPLKSYTTMHLIPLVVHNSKNVVVKAFAVLRFIQLHPL